MTSLQLASVSARIPLDLRGDLEAIAHANNVDLSTVVRIALRDAVETRLGGRSAPTTLAATLLTSGTGPAAHRGGTRGAPRVLTADQATELISRWHRDDYGRIRLRILELADVAGEVHADALAAEELAEPNVIGAAFRALTRGGFIVSTGEHRASDNPAARRRRSYVYRLTIPGAELLRAHRAAERKATAAEQSDRGSLSRSGSEGGSGGNPARPSTPDERTTDAGAEPEGSADA